MKKNKTKKKKHYVPEKIDVQQQVLPSAEIITARHWLPDTKEIWDKRGDLRTRLLRGFAASGHFAMIIEEAIVMDPDKPDPVKVIGSNWIHADVHGIMTEEIFFEDLTKCIAEFADVVVNEQNPFQPVRLYKDANAAYGVGFFDWRGEEYPFDIRALCQFGNWEFTTDKQEQVVASGFRFWLSTLVLPREEDADVLVARDMAKGYFDDD